MCILWPPYVHTLASICAYFGLRRWAGILLCTCRSAPPSLCNLFNTDQKLENDWTYLSQTQSSHSPCVAEKSYWFCGHWVNSHLGQICQNRFWWLTRKRIDLPFSCLLQTYIISSIGTLLILWSLGKRSRSPRTDMPKPFPLNSLRTHWPTFFKHGSHIRYG